MTSDEKNNVTTEPETASTPDTEQPTRPAHETPPESAPAVSAEPDQPNGRSEESTAPAAELPQPPPEPAVQQMQTSAPSEPAAESPSAPAEPTPTEPAAASEPESRPRPQLNPTVDPNTARPVPSLETPSMTPPVSPVPTAPPPEAEEKQEEAPPVMPSAQVTPSQAPAEIPKAGDLDADLEAQIAAAQAGDEAAGSQPAPPPAPPAEGAAGPQQAPAPTSEEDLEPGHRLRGKVQSIAGDDVFFDVGFRSPALVSLRQFDPEKSLEVGQQLTLVVDRVSPDEGLIHANLPRGRRKIQGNWDAITVGQVVDCMVTKTNKGGLEITVSNIRGFLPASQVDLHYVSDLEKFVGEKLTVKITEANRSKRNLIVSRRAYLQEEREAVAQDVWKSLEVGQTKKGVVKTLKDYGAFVDIGGVDGFLHIGEMSWNHIRHPSDILSEGQEVDVQILSLDPDRKRIGLGMRQLVQNPWDSATQKYPQNSTVNGRVTRTTDFGAFVELEPGVEGLVHISELDHRRVNKVTDVLNVGDEPELQVLDVDLGRKRISLSLKALKDKPPELDKKSDKRSDEDFAPSGGEGYARKRKGPLKGGTGGTTGGGLFGDPGDFS